jgi:hypothetical protein
LEPESKLPKLTAGQPGVTTAAASARKSPGEVPGDREKREAGGSLPQADVYPETRTASMACAAR